MYRGVACPALHVARGGPEPTATRLRRGKKEGSFWILGEAGARLVDKCERYEGQRVPATEGHRAEPTHDSMSEEFYIVTSCTLLMARRQRILR
jgi:mannose-6-phosphate isomerase-like protein (cupin superfamily)